MLALLAMPAASVSMCPEAGSAVSGYATPGDTVNSQHNVHKAKISSAKSNSSFLHPCDKADLSGGHKCMAHGVLTGTWLQGSSLLRHLPTYLQVTRITCSLPLPAHCSVY